MAGIARPKPCYLDSMTEGKVIGGRKTWHSLDRELIYTWDSLHGEIELFNKRGKHLGVLHAVTGVLIKEAIKGRKLDVS